jgi:PAS domain-containing protein
VAPEQRDSVRGQLAQLFAGQERFFAEFQVQHPDGHSYWIRALGCSRQDASGKVVELYGSLTNIDGEHRQMEAQEDLLEQLSLTLEASQVGWVKINPEDLSLLLDQRAEQFLGLEAVSWPPHLPHLLHQWVHPEDQQLFGAAIDRVLSREPQPAIEFRVLPPDHELRWLSCHFGHFRRRLGHEIYLVLQNITARKTAMQGQERLFAELQQERQWTQQARQLSPSGTWRWDPQTDHTDWTPEMYEMLGVSEETALGTETSLR